MLETCKILLCLSTTTSENPFHALPGQEKIIFFLGAQPEDKNVLQTNGVFLC